MNFGTIFVYVSIRSYWAHDGPKTSWAGIQEDVRSRIPLPDDITTRNAITKLKELASKGLNKPFFLAVGFFKPHTPVYFPEKFLKYYPNDS